MAYCCPKCDGFLEGLTIDKPRAYLELAYRLLGLIKEGIFVVTEGSCPLEDLFKPEWPSDTVEHNLQCKVCGRTFQLFADTYHGHAAWDLTGPQTKEPALETTATS